MAVGFTVAGVPVIGLIANGSSSRTWRMLTVAVGAPSTIDGAPANQASQKPNSMISDPVQASLEGSHLPVTPLPIPQPDYAISALYFNEL